MTSSDKVLLFSDPISGIFYNYKLSTVSSLSKPSPEKITSVLDNSKDELQSYIQYSTDTNDPEIFICFFPYDATLAGKAINQGDPLVIVKTTGLTGVSPPEELRYYSFNTIITGSLTTPFSLDLTIQKPKIYNSSNNYFGKSLVIPSAFLSTIKATNPTDSIYNGLYHIWNATLNDPTSFLWVPKQGMSISDLFIGNTLLVTKKTRSGLTISPSDKFAIMNQNDNLQLVIENSNPLSIYDAKLSKLEDIATFEVKQVLNIENYIDTSKNSNVYTHTNENSFNINYTSIILIIVIILIAIFILVKI
jgi:hypothetical protein